MKLMIRRVLLGVAVPAILLLATSAEAGETKLSGLLFGDYYWVAANHLDSLKNQNGFWIRRIYFTVDQTIAPAWDMRLRLEAGSPGTFTGASASMTPFIKDAYLRWQPGMHAVILGISPSPTWDVIESIWGYRDVEKTPLDLQKMGSSREFGVAVKGALDQAKTVRYHVMVGNGNGEKSETDKYKKVLGSVGFYPTEKVVVEGYADFEAHQGHYDRYTLQGFAVCRTKTARAGVMFAHQSRQNGIDTQGHDKKNVVINVGSVFAAASVTPQVALLGRVDHLFDANPDAAKIAYMSFAPDVKSTLIIGGLDFSPAANVHLIPNIEVVAYGKSDAAGTSDKPKADVFGKFTFSYQWK